MIELSFALVTFEPRIVLFIDALLREAPEFSSSELIKAIDTPHKQMTIIANIRSLFFGST